MFSVWDETDEPLDLIAGLVGRVGRVAIGSQTWATFLLGLQARLPETEFISADPMMTEMRIRKSSEEIEALAEVGAGADRVAGRLTGGRICRKERTRAFPPDQRHAGRRRARDGPVLDRCLRTQRSLTPSRTGGEGDGEGRFGGLRFRRYSQRLLLRHHPYLCGR